MLIRIELPRDRDYCGRLFVLDDAGAVAFGPVWCAGRANDAAAGRRGNDGRSCLLPYGDTPPGGYRLRHIISMREASEYALRQFGRFGIASLGATGGPALMADGVGRFEIWIHGGTPAPDGGLTNTNGSIRLAEADTFGLLNTIKGKEGARCEVVETERRPDAPRVHVDAFFDEGDPPSLDETARQPEWPIAAEPPHPLRTIFLGEYDGGASESSGGSSDSDSGKSGSDSAQAAADSSNPPQDADAGAKFGGADTSNPSRVSDSGEKFGDTDTSNPDRPAGMAAKAGEVGSRRQESGWGAAIGSFFRSFFRDTTVSSNWAPADEGTEQTGALAKLVAKFDAVSARKFADLPEAARKALSGLAEVYGDNLDTALPEFWSTATSGQWPAAVQALLRTRDGHVIARTRAADLLHGAVTRRLLP